MDQIRDVLIINTITLLAALVTIVMAYFVDLVPSVTDGSEIGSTFSDCVSRLTLANFLVECPTFFLRCLAKRTKSAAPTAHPSSRTMKSFQSTLTGYITALGCLKATRGNGRRTVSFFSFCSATKIGQTRRLGFKGQN